MDALGILENMKIQQMQSNGSEPRTRELASETLLQLQTAKRSVETLRSDVMKTIEAYNSIAAELELSRGRVNELEDLVCKLKSEPENCSNNNIQQPVPENRRPEEEAEVLMLKAQISSLNAKVEWLKSALEAAEIRSREEKIRSLLQIRSAYELVQQMMSGLILKEAELEAELRETRARIDEFKTELVQKESQFQVIAKENERLNLTLEKGITRQRHFELENKFMKLTETVNVLRTSLKDKEVKLQNALDENETLKAEFRRRENDSTERNDNLVAQLEKARKAQREANAKLELAMQEAEKRSRKISRVTEQLEVARAVNSGLEVEMRRMKVQFNQWRKAAETAAAMAYAGNDGKLVRRTASLDREYCNDGEKVSSLDDDMVDDLRRSGILKKIGVLWRKPKNTKT